MPLTSRFFRTEQTLLLALVVVQLFIALQAARHYWEYLSDLASSSFWGFRKEPWLFVELPVFGRGAGEGLLSCNAAFSPHRLRLSPQTIGGATFDRASRLSRVVPDVGNITSIHPPRKGLQSIKMYSLLEGGVFVTFRTTALPCDRGASEQDIGLRAAVRSGTSDLVLVLHRDGHRDEVDCGGSATPGAVSFEQLRLSHLVVHKHDAQRLGNGRRRLADGHEATNPVLPTNGGQGESSMLTRPLGKCQYEHLPLNTAASM